MAVITQLKKCVKRIHRNLFFTKTANVFLSAKKKRHKSIFTTTWMWWCKHKNGSAEKIAYSCVRMQMAFIDCTRTVVPAICVHKSADFSCTSQPHFPCSKMIGEENKNAIREREPDVQYEKGLKNDSRLHQHTRSRVRAIFSHMLLKCFHNVPIGIGKASCSFRRSSEQARRSENYTLKQHRKKLQHMTLLWRNKKKHCVVYIRKAKKKFTLERPSSSNTKFSAIFLLLVWVRGKLFRLSGWLLVLVLVGRRTPCRLIFISFIPAWFRNSRKRIVYAIWRLLYNIQHLHIHTSYARCEAWSCAFQHTLKILSRSLSIAEKILK